MICFRREEDSSEKSHPECYSGRLADWGSDKTSRNWVSTNCLHRWQQWQQQSWSPCIFVSSWFDLNMFYKLFLLRFALNPSEVGSKMEGVPIQETMLSDMCPDIESAFCFPHKYRTINGECNNVKNPTWGITGAAYLRILEPTYQDGESWSYILILINPQYVGPDC